MTIWKFIIDNVGTQTIMVPAEARLLTVQTQGTKSKPRIWAMVNPENPFVELTIRIFGTGEPIDQSEPLTYLGTFHLFEGNFVGHVFYRW